MSSAIAPTDAIRSLFLKTNFRLSCRERSPKGRVRSRVKGSRCSGNSFAVVEGVIWVVRESVKDRFRGLGGRVFSLELLERGLRALEGPHAEIEDPKRGLLGSRWGTRRGDPLPQFHVVAPLEGDFRA